MLLEFTNIFRTPCTYCEDDKFVWRKIFAKFIYTRCSLESLGAEIEIGACQNFRLCKTRAGRSRCVKHVP